MYTRQTGVKHGNPADSQVEKSGSPPAIFGVRMPGFPLVLYTAVKSQSLYPPLPPLMKKVSVCNCNSITSLIKYMTKADQKQTSPHLGD